MSTGSRPARSAALVVAVGAAMFVDAMLYSVVVPLLPSFAQRFGAGPVGMTVLYAGYAAALLLATPVVGRLGDRTGHRLGFLAGTVAVAVATLAFATADSYPALFVARCVQGAAAAAVWTSGIALVAGRVEAGKVGAALGTLMAAMSMGLIVGPPLGGLLLDRAGPGAPFVACALAAAGVALLAPIAVRGGPGQAGGRQGPAPVRDVLGGTGVPATLAAVIAGAAGLSLLEPLLPLDVTSRLGAGPLAIGLVFGLATLANGLAGPLAGIAADRRPGAPAIPIGLVAMGLLTLPIARLGRITAVAAVLAGFAIAYSFVLVTAMARLARLAEPARGAEGSGEGSGDGPAYGSGYGTVYAAFNIAYAVGMVAGPLAGGLAVTAAGTSAAYTVGGLALVACGAALMGRGRSRSSRSTGPLLIGAAPAFHPTRDPCLTRASPRP